MVYENNESARAAASAIKALSILHNNPEDLSAFAAARAASEGRPAYWSTARYHDQRARNFLDEANDLPLAAALELRKQSRTWNGDAAGLINTLIPLNAEAAKALAEIRKFI